MRRCTLVAFFFERFIVLKFDPFIDTTSQLTFSPSTQGYKLSFLLLILGIGRCFECDYKKSLKSLTRKNGFHRLKIGPAFLKPRENYRLPIVTRFKPQLGFLRDKDVP